jgi:hypothetical protein
MSHASRLSAAVLACAASLSFAVPASAQEPPRAVVSIYRPAPGKQLDFLKWMAAREAVAREAGIPAQQWYAHISGDSWDFLVIGPDLDDAASDKVDALERKRGLKVGPAASLEFREVMAWHTDTLAAGPMTAAQLIDAAGKP